MEENAPLIPAAAVAVALLIVVVKVVRRVGQTGDEAIKQTKLPEKLVNH